jgi:hypothetical protein
VSIYSMPKEIVLKIFSYIIAENLLNVKNLNIVCSDWHKVCLNSLLWKYINLSNKKINIDQFLQFSIKNQLYGNLVELNLNGLVDLENGQLETIVDNIRNECLKEINISNCKRVKSSILVKIADKFNKLQTLEIQSIIKNEV